MLITSFLAYLVGEFANAYVLVRSKIATDGRWLWSRTIGSTLVGQARDRAPAHLRRILVCAYETDMRSGEIKELTWDKVDFASGFIRLATEDTKTSYKRAIPNSAVCREVLDGIRTGQRQGKVAPIGGQVFTWGGKRMTEGWKRAFSTLCRKAALDYVHFHDMRLPL